MVDAPKNDSIASSKPEGVSFLAGGLTNRTPRTGSTMSDIPYPGVQNHTFPKALRTNGMYCASAPSLGC